MQVIINVALYSVITIESLSSDCMLYDVDDDKIVMLLQVIQITEICM